MKVADSVTVTVPVPDNVPPLCVKEPTVSVPSSSSVAALRARDATATEALFGMLTMYAPDRSMTTLSTLCGSAPSLQFAAACAASVQVPPLVLIHSSFCPTGAVDGVKVTSVPPEVPSRDSTNSLLL